jgi:hypothetical protein
LAPWITGYEIRLVGSERSSRKIEWPCHNDDGLVINLAAPKHENEWPTMTTTHQINPTLFSISRQVFAAILSLATCEPPSTYGVPSISSTYGVPSISTTYGVPSTGWDTSSSSSSSHINYVAKPLFHATSEGQHVDEHLLNTVKRVILASENAGSGSIKPVYGPPSHWFNKAVDIHFGHPIQSHPIGYYVGKTYAPTYSTGWVQKPSTGWTEAIATGWAEKPSTGWSDLSTGWVEKPSTGWVEKPSTGWVEKPSTEWTQSLSTGWVERPSTTYGVPQW